MPRADGSFMRVEQVLAERVQGFALVELAGGRSCGDSRVGQIPGGVDRAERGLDLGSRRRPCTASSSTSVADCANTVSRIG
ncbi:hypothetical protein BJF84_20870 [Rhodococcus sp. CUA-806]|nr:hypothetical protein BJF84_20870 [Rhodococcus sp. CUA-806]